MSDKKIIHNKFFDLLSFLTSFFVSFFRSFFQLFSNKKIKQNIFFDILDFIFRKWPKYFWKKPSLYKITAFFGDLLRYIFK